MTADDEIKKHWDEQADKHKGSDLATAPDHSYRELEISRIMPHITNNSQILDIGCGNGYSTLKFAAEYPGAHIIGVDFSENMIDQANENLKAHQNIKNVTFMVGDIRQLAHLKELRNKCDIIISERCLINLKSFAEQKSAMLQLKYTLNPGGKLILVENTIEGLDNLNKLRKQFGLEQIKTKWHNQYLPHLEFLKFARLHFQIQTVDNIGNLYYLLSRVVYAKMCAMEGKEPQYNHPINLIAGKLPSLPAYAWSPNYLYVMRNMYE